MVFLSGQTTFIYNINSFLSHSLAFFITCVIYTIG